MKKWNLIIDVAKCFNCNCCTLSCHDEYHGNEWPGYAAEMPKHGHRWIDILQRETGVVPMVEVTYLPVMCNHCDNPPCQKVAQNNAVAKRPDGIVIIIPERAKGQKQIMEACPYNAVWWNDEKDIPQAWPFDAHLLDTGWKKTRGSQVCPTQAMRTLYVEDEEMQAIIEAEGLEVLHPEYGAKPRVYYKNLQRFRTVFIGGSLGTTANDVAEAVEGAQLTLEQNGKVVAETASDGYGDFKFAGLKPDSGSYKLRISHPQFASKTFDVQLQQQSICLPVDLAPVKAAAVSTI